MLATQFMRWFDGLWHGRSLASTVAFLTLLLAFGFWFIATRYAQALVPAEDDQGSDGTSS